MSNYLKKVYISLKLSKNFHLPLVTRREVRAVVFLFILLVVVFAIVVVIVAVLVAIRIVGLFVIGFPIL